MALPTFMPSTSPPPPPSPLTAPDIAGNLLKRSAQMRSQMIIFAETLRISLLPTTDEASSASTVRGAHTPLEIATALETLAPASTSFIARLGPVWQFILQLGTPIGATPPAVTAEERLAWTAQAAADAANTDTTLQKIGQLNTLALSLI